MTPPPTDLVDQLRHEIDEEAPPPAIVLPPVSGPLSNAAASVVNTIEEEAGDNETDEEASDDDSYKGPTFIRSLGAWSKPLHFTPPPTPPELATPRFGDTEMLQSQIDSFWPSIGEAIVNGPKKKGHLMFPKKSVTQMPVDKIPPPTLKEDGSLRFPWAARMNQSSRNLFRATEPTYRLDGTPQVTIPSKVDAFPITIMFGMCSIFIFAASILQRRLMVISENPKGEEPLSPMKERNSEVDPLIMFLSQSK